MRCAMAYATDEQAIIDKVEAGVSKLANGPFSPAQVGHLEDSGFPLKQDMAKAQELIASLQGRASGPAEHQPVDDAGRDEPGHRPGPAGVLQAGRLRRRADRPDRAGEVHPHRAAGQLPGVPVAQPRRLRPRQPVHLVALVATPCPSAQLALNFGRIKDPEIDKALADNRGADRSGREEGATPRRSTSCSRSSATTSGARGRCGGIPHAPNVMDVGVFTHPDGDAAEPRAPAARSTVRSVWINPNA